MPLAAFEELNRRQEEAGQRLFVNPRNSPPDRYARRTPPITASRELAFWCVPARRGRSAAPSSPAPPDPASSWPSVGAAGQPGDRDGLDSSTTCTATAPAGRSTATTSATRSTASSSRSTTWPSGERLGLHQQGAPVGHRLQVPARGTTTVLDDIMVSIGRTGRATPFAVLHAGLRRRIHRRPGHAPQRGPGARQGRPARATRSSSARPGDVIPEVVGPVVSLRPDGAEPWVFPTVCPCPLRSTLVRLEGESRHRSASNRRLPGPAGAAHHPLRRRAAPWTSRGWASGRSCSCPSWAW